MKRLPGFRFDSKAGRTSFEVMVPGTKSDVWRQETVEASTMDEALTKGKAFRKRILSGALGPAEPRTVCWYFETFWPRMKAAVPLENGRAAVEQAMRCGIPPRIGGLLLEKVNDAEVGDFVASMRKAKYAAATINETLSVLRKFLRDVPAREVVEKYPLRRGLVTHAEECGVKSNDVVISALELYLSLPRKTTPVARPTIVRKKGTKGGR
jgi:hypothetical protein